jgi:ribonucleotide reductase beta subunit family protein with ferritin-like domain
LGDWERVPRDCLEMWNTVLDTQRNTCIPIVFDEYLRFIADRRFQQIGIDPLFDKVHNPFLRMAEMIDLKKEKNFFETRVIEY